MKARSWPRTQTTIPVSGSIRCIWFISAVSARIWDTDMPTMNMIQALNSGLDVMLGRDPNVLTFGEDAGYFGGVFRVTDGLQKKYGPTRCFDSPISEGGFCSTQSGSS